MVVEVEPIPKEYATVTESSIASLTFPECSSRDVMTNILREGAQRMLAQAIQEEVQAWIAERAELRDGDGRQLVVRNGYLPERKITTGVGQVAVGNHSGSPG